MTSHYKTTKLSTNAKPKSQGTPPRRAESWQPETGSLTRDELRAIVLRTLG